MEAVEAVEAGPSDWPVWPWLGSHTHADQPLGAYGSRRLAAVHYTKDREQRSDRHTCVVVVGVKHACQAEVAHPQVARRGGVYQPALPCTALSHD